MLFIMCISIDKSKRTMYRKYITHSNKKHNQVFFIERSFFMEYFEAAAKRASYRDTFKTDDIPEADLRRILTAAIQAPTGYNYQTTTFVAVTDDALRHAISSLIPTKATQSAPVILVVLSETHPADTGLVFEIEDYAAATENIMLGLAALGYAGVWMDGQTKKDGVASAISDILNIPSDKHVRTIIPCGIPEKEISQAPKKSYEERVSYNRFL